MIKITLFNDRSHLRPRIICRNCTLKPAGNPTGTKYRAAATFHKNNRKMNVLKPVSTIMTRQLITVDPADNLKTVKDIFDTHNIHHIPVVRYKNITGIVSKTDFDRFMHGMPKGAEGGNDLIEQSRLESWKVRDIMTEKLAKVDSQEPIRTVLSLFKINRFRAIPVVDGDELVGMVTTYDIIDALADEPIELQDYKTAKA